MHARPYIRLSEEVYGACRRRCRLVFKGVYHVIVGVVGRRLGAAKLVHRQVYEVAERSRARQTALDN
jgi:hypothetical protein